MNISVRARKLAFDRDTMWIELDDGRSLGVPLEPIQFIPVHNLLR